MPHKDKQKRQEYNRKHRILHREQYQAYQRKYRASHREQHLIYQLEWRRKSHKRLRQQVLQKYGDKCIRCGFSDPRALQIDHVNGGGVKEYRTIGGLKILKKALLDTSNLYQLLCANCNWIKRHENNECHRSN